MLSRERSILLVFGLVLTLVTVQCGTRSEPKKPAGEFLVNIETLPPMTVASLNKRESATGVVAALNELKDWLKRSGVVPTGVPFALYYYEAPVDVALESLDWAVCVPVAAGFRADEKSGVRVAHFPQMTVATAFHHGDKDVRETAGRLGEWVEENGWEISGPALAFYLNGDTPSESIKVKVGFMVQPLSDSLEEPDEIELEEEGG